MVCVHRVALCLDGQRRFTQGSRQLLGSEATKQRHLRLLGYHVVQVSSLVGFGQPPQPYL